MTRTLFDQPLDLLERRFQALQERAASLPEASRQELETALQELSQAIAALRADREAGRRTGPDPPRGRAAPPGQSETILQHIFDAIPDVLTVIDRDFNIVLSNWHLPDLMLKGVKPGESKCYRVYHHQDRPCEDCHVLEVIATGRPQKTEKFNEIDGQHMEFNAFPILDASGQVILVAEHVRNITERHLAAEALRESEKRFRTLIEDSPESLFLTDVQGTVLAASRVAARRLGKNLEEIIGASLFDLFPPEVASRRRDFFKKAVATRRPFRLEDARGNLHFDIHINPIPDAEGKVSRLSILAIDITDRKKAEQALKESEERFRMLFEHVPDAYILADMQGEIIDCNQATEKLAGYGREELIGNNFACLPWLDFRQQVRLADLLAQTAHGEVMGPVDFTLTRKDGGEVIAEGMSLPLSIQGQNLVLTIVRDVTARKQAEAALRESEESYRVLFEGSTHGILVVDMETGRFGYANPSICRMLGYSDVELRQLGVADIHPQDSLDQVMFEFESLVRGEKTLSAAIPCRRKDGTVFYADIASTESIIQGRRYAVGFFMDVTERRQAEEALRESEQRFRLMAETIQDVFWISTPEIDNMIYVSPAYELVFGRPVAELYQSPQAFLESIHPEDREQAKSEIFANQRHGLSFSQKYRIIRADGAVRWLQNRAFPVRDDQGRVTLFTGVATDITEHKALEGQLLQAQKMEAVGRLAGGVAHDFNNLLMAITGYGELMRAKVLKDDPLYGYLENILKAGDRAAALTQQLLTFSRQKIVNPQVIDLNRVVLDLEPMLRRLIGEDLDLEVVTDREPGAVKADPGHLGQIIMNLVVNARDAMPIGGRLTLKTAPVNFTVGCHSRFGLTPPGAYVMLEVQDTGVGMDEATQTHVFEPFFTTKEPGKGTGLGLSTVYGIVKQSGGYLDLESKPGAGSTFTVYLPRLDQVVEPPRVKIPITARFRGKETILLVEDEDVLRGLLAKFLRLYGYAVLEASHGGEALLTCERHQGPIHLMVTDVVMPQMSGRELADRLTPLRPEMKVLYMSGYTEDAVIQHGVADLSVAFLQKPFKPIELARRVHAVLHPAVGR